MSVSEELLVMLSGVEERLAARLRAAAEERSYQDIPVIAAVSQRVHDLIAELENGKIETRGNGTAELLSTTRTKLGPATISTTSGGRSTNRLAYPRFGRDGDRLVKVGWSKKAKSEYEHKASHATVLAVAETLRNLEGKEFSMEDVLPLSDMSGEGIPSYQAYLVLAWFCSLGAVRKEGRGGYVPMKAALDPQSIAAHWDKLGS